MNLKKWTVLGVGSLIVAAASVLGKSSGLLSFGSAAYTIAVSQTTSGGQPQYSYESWWGQDIAALALGAEPTANQVLALAVSCGSSSAVLVVYDTITSNVTTVAQATSFDKVQNSDTSGAPPDRERFVAVFAVQPVGNLVGGYLTVAGRLHLDASGCAQSVLLSQDRDSLDKAMGDEDVVKASHEKSKSITQRTGQAHFMGVLSVLSNGQTNTVLVPTGHLTLTSQLD